MKNIARAGRNTGKRPASSKRSMLEPLAHVWLAGLGAASRAQKKGPKWLRDLIKEGVRLEAIERKAAMKVVRNALGGVGVLARRAVDELPPVRMLKEVRALRKQVDAMSAKLDKLARARAAPRKQRRTREVPR